MKQASADFIELQDLQKRRKMIDRDLSSLDQTLVQTEINF